MSVQNSGGFHSAGRIRGHYVYMLLCSGEGDIHIKVGHSVNPLDRLKGIRTGCPFIPDTFATMHVANRTEAKRIELVLHGALKKWRVHGEWFRMTLADKAEFNEACGKVISAFRRPNWPLKWVKMNAANYIKTLEENGRKARQRWKQRGGCYQGFTRDLHARPL